MKDYNLTKLKENMKGIMDIKQDNIFKKETFNAEIMQKRPVQ